ncbi:MAG: hypothetical protein E7659_07055 [Ruminococcaceae bacterium]|nr:hypothetical protein [Oscillospiraceae bacterium]
MSFCGNNSCLPCARGGGIFARK